MALDPSASASKLAALTADLKPLPGASHEKLHQARVLIASALASVNSSVHLPSPSAALPASTPTAPELLGALEAAISESSPDLVDGNSFAIVRRTIPLTVSGISGLSPDAVAGYAADRTFGPFLDPIGRQVWIDLYPFVRQVNLVRVAGGAPFLSIPVRGLLGPDNRLVLGPGSVWIASSMLATGAPTGS
jgi:hypothetical protein